MSHARLVMLSSFAITMPVVAILGFAGSALAQPNDCGAISIANYNYASAQVLAEVDRIILSAGYGCDAKLVPGDTMPTIASMTEKAEPDVAPEVWVQQFSDVIEPAVEEGRIELAANSLTDGSEEGWWIPQYLADAHPEIETVKDALARPDLFPDPEDPSRGAVYNCPAGWACQVTTAQLYKAYGGDKKNFRLVDTGSAAGLDGSISRAYERKQGWLGYYWSPTAILGRYAMKKLPMDADYDQAEWERCITKPDCPDPKVSGYTTMEVRTAITPRIAEMSNGAANYLKTRGWSNETVNTLLAWKDESQATGEDTAYHFLEENPDVWTKWVPADVAERVKGEL